MNRRWLSFFGACWVFLLSISSNSNSVTVIGSSGLIGDGIADDTIALQDLLDRGGVCVIPEGRFRVSGTLRASKFSVISIKGIICGGGSLEFLAGCAVSGGGGFEDFPLKFRAGSCTVDNVSFSGKKHTQAVLIQGVGEFPLIAIKSCIFEKCNFGVLRQGAGSVVRRAELRGNRFSEMDGDAIEWNVATSDFGLEIRENIISGVDNSRGKPNWGIGIGVSGNSYTDSYAEAESVKDFIIADNVISSARQGIHVECGKRFSIARNRVSEISALLSVGSGLEVAGIVVYGSSAFDISDNQVSVDSGRSIYCIEGSIRGKLVNVCSDFSILRNVCRGGAVLASIGMSESVVSVLGNKISGNLQIYGRSGTLIITNNSVESVDARPAFDLDFKPKSGFGRQFGVARSTLVKIADNKFISRGRSPASINGMLSDRLDFSGNNFKM